MQEGELAYFGRTKGTYKPLKPSHNFKRQKARVALLWGDPVYVIKLRGDRCTVSAKGHHLEIPRSHLSDTSLLSILSVRDVTQRMRELQSSSFLPFEPFNTAAILYVGLTLAASRFLKWIERRSRVEGQ